MGEEKLPGVFALKSTGRYLLTIVTLFIALALAFGGTSIQSAKAVEGSRRSAIGSDFQDEQQANLITPNNSVVADDESAYISEDQLEPAKVLDNELDQGDSPTPSLSDNEIEYLEDEAASITDGRSSVPDATVMAGESVDANQLVESERPAIENACAPGTVYALHGWKGIIYKVTEGNVQKLATLPADYLKGITHQTPKPPPGGWPPGFPIPKPTPTHRPNRIYNINGLAVDKKGDTFYFNFRDPGLEVVRIYKYIASQDAWAPVITKPMKKASSSFIVGAVDPSNGDYLYGGWDKETINGVSTDVFVIYRYRPSDDSNTYVGYFVSPGNVLSNGDMAFSEDGTLHIVHGTEAKYTIVTIAKEDLAASVGGEIPHTVSSEMNLDDGNTTGFNGIAFDARGWMYLGDRNTVRVYTPSGAAINNSYATGFKEPGDNDGFNFDLAGCSYFPALGVKKNLPGVSSGGETIYRKNANDQFTLTLTDVPQDQINGNITTFGNDGKVQKAHISQLPVMVDHVYKVQETIVPDNSSTELSKLSDYDVELECRDQNNEIIPHENFTLTDTTASAEIKIPYVSDPEIDKSDALRVWCTFSNTPKGETQATANLKVLKKDSTDQSLLAGASFKLWKDVNGNGEWDLDDTEIPGSEKPITVANEGVLWNELELGKYIIEETVAPTGYTISNQYTAVTLNKADADTTVTVEVLDDRKLGSVSWSKVAGDINGPALAGSEWTITDKKDDTKTWVVKDCVTDAAECDAVFVDTNKAAGEFTVLQLPLGEYTLKESKAPAGYKLDSTSHTFQITAQNPDFKFDDGFINEQVVPPVIPVTGGVGSDFYLISGGILLAAGAAAGYAQNLRRNRKRLNATKSNKEDI